MPDTVRVAAVIFLITLFSIQCISKPHKEPTSREDTEHFVDDPARHDVQFDHNAFLGKEKVEEFSKLTPEQSRDKLKQIIKRIDKDSDGKITQSEMKDWITYVASSSSQKVTDKRWSEINPSQKENIEWDEYLENTYGPEADRMSDPTSAETYKKYKRMDERRWKSADLNKDNKLNRKELDALLHPEDNAHMKEAMIDELLDLVDKDQDGRVSQQEYLEDIARAYQHVIIPGEKDPEWLATEREQFVKYRDSDGDGVLNREEVGEWIVPANYDPQEAEVQHLFYHADSNQDNLLTEEEILEKQDIFVSSQATDYGNTLHMHQEL